MARPRTRVRRVVTFWAAPEVWEEIERSAASEGMAVGQYLLSRAVAKQAAYESADGADGLIGSLFAEEATTSTGESKQAAYENTDVDGGLIGSLFAEEGDADALVDRLAESLGAAVSVPKQAAYESADVEQGLIGSLFAGDETQSAEGLGSKSKQAAYESADVDGGLIGSLSAEEGESDLAWLEEL